MNKPLLTSILCLVPITAHGQVVPKSPLRQAIRASRMLDPRTGKYLPNAVILITGDRITSVGTNLSIPPDTKTIDLGDLTLLPGLIDCHTHLLENYDMKLGGDDPNMILTVAQMNVAKRALLGVKMGREDLESGITTVRDLGNSGHNGDVALRDAIDAGWVVGPRIVAGTRALSATGGQFGTLAAEAQKLVDQEYAVVSGPEEARKAVRQALYDGADCIKIIVDTSPRILGLEELKVIVAEAHRVGKKVAAHAVTDDAIRSAALAGVDSIEHGYFASDAAFKLMAEHKVFLVPTDFPASYYFDGTTLTPEQRKRAEQGAQQFAQSNQNRLSRAIKAGVRIAAGSDAYYQFSGKSRGQASQACYKAYAAAGMPPLEIIRAATINAAELLGRQASIGALETGKFADLIAVPGDPLKDSAVLEQTQFVMKGGEIIRHDKK